MAESTELSNLKPKSTGCDNNDFEELQDEEVEQAKRDATADSTGEVKLTKRDATADSTGLGRFLFRGVTGAVDAAVASFGGFGRKNGPDGTAGPGKKETTTIVVKEPQSHKQTTAEKRTGPQLQVCLIVARYI